MPIRVDVLVNVHKRNIDNATRVLKSDFQKAAKDIGNDVGKEIGDRIAQGIRSSSAEVNKAMDDATNSAITRRRAKERLKEIKKLYKAGEADVETYRRAVEDLGKATRDYDLKVRKLRETEEGFQKTFRERADVTRAAHVALKDFTASHDDHLNTLQQLRAANLDVIRQNNMVAKAFDTAGSSITKSGREYEKFLRLEKEGKATRDQLLTQWHKVHDAWDKEAQHIRDATAALSKHGAEQQRHAARQEEHLRRQRERANNSDLGEVGSWAARNLGALTPSVLSRRRWFSPWVWRSLRSPTLLSPPASRRRCCLLPSLPARQPWARSRWRRPGSATQSPRSRRATWRSSPP